MKPANVHVAIEDTAQHAVALARDSDRLRQHRLDRQRFLELGRAPDSVRGQVRTSWRRSILSGVIPDRLLLPFDSEMDRAGRLLAAARPVLHRLAATLDGTNTSFLLTDRSGLILDRWVGSTDLARQLDRNLTAAGYSLDEQYAGTNGPGTAIEVGRPVQICGPEHFADQYQELTCAGVPIRHPLTGCIEGVVDITCPLSETNAIMLPYMVEAATEIERRLYMRTSARERLLLDEFLIASQRTSAPVIAINESVIIANASAGRLLDGADQMVLWERAAAVARAQTTAVVDLELPTGRVLKLSCRTVFDGRDRLGAILEGEQETRPYVRSARRQLTPALPGLAAGRSMAWREVARLAATVATQRMPCVITGEPGVGKAAIARAMGEMSRGTSSTIEFDAAQACSAGDRQWLDTVEKCFGGDDATVILAHIDTLADSTARGLSALIDRQPGTAQVIATSSVAESRPSAALTSLLARLQVASIEVPPLRNRIEDLPALVSAFTSRHGTAQHRFRSDALQALSRHDWPGNVRELENIVRWSVSACRSLQIGIEELPAQAVRNASSRHLTAIERAELEAIVRALKDAGGNKNAAARELGFARSTLYRKLHYYSVDLERALYLTRPARVPRSR